MVLNWSIYWKCYLVKSFQLKREGFSDDHISSVTVIQLLNFFGAKRYLLEKYLKNHSLMANKTKAQVSNKISIFLLIIQIKLVNINASDIVDGRPSVVLGLIWTIILYFQVNYYWSFHLRNKVLKFA